MSKLLKIDEMLDCSAELLPEREHSYWVNAVERVADQVAAALCDATGLIAGGASFEGSAFAGTCVAFFKRKRSDDVPECIKLCDETEPVPVYGKGAPPPRQRIKKVCTRCGSFDVTHDATVRWDEIGQMWEANDPFDNADCGSCGGECNIEDVPYDYDPFAHGKPVTRIEIAEHKNGFTVRLYDPMEIRGVNNVGQEAKDEKEADAIAERWAKDAPDFAHILKLEPRP